MVAIGASLGALLIVSHHMIIGALILAMALVRAAILVTVRKRRAALRSGTRRIAALLTAVYWQLTKPSRSKTSGGTHRLFALA